MLSLKKKLMITYFVIRMCPSDSSLTNLSSILINVYTLNRFIEC